jgi:beta-glucosidase
MDIDKLISEMTLEEKASLCSGEDFWHTKSIERLGIPSIMMSDGPNGLRKQEEKADHLGKQDSIEAVCYPTGSAVASSFDCSLVHEMGEALGEECRAENVDVILGPAVNIKRSPLCGRNFEYYSEDPLVAGEVAASFIDGVQSRGVGTSIKHFLVNSQEYRRMTSSSNIDERTLREIYLPAFERAVKKSQPWTVMSSYNRVNGEYASESYHYLTEILRDEWGFDGLTVSDWGAVNDRVKGIAAGLDLEMPTSFGINDQRIVEGVKAGVISVRTLDEAVKRVLMLIQRSLDGKNTAVHEGMDKEKHHDLARRLSSESMVLLKNEGILPLKKNRRIAFIGEFAKVPRYQGGGSSHIHAYRITSALESAEKYADVTYAQGYETSLDQVNPRLIAEAAVTAQEAEAAVIFAGLPDSYESEGYDRKHMRLPENQSALIREILRVQPNTIIVLHNGSPVEMPWAEDVKGILEAYLGGEAVGEAVTDVLFGAVNPSGRLAESIPLRLEDNPSYLFYRGEKDEVDYREGIFVGYRYYEKRKMPVRFPFGYGLSYTTYAYSNFKADRTQMNDTDSVRISLDITNTGAVAGKEVVQIYVIPPQKDVIRPDKELKAFDKIELQPGEKKTVEFTLEKRDFAYYNTETHDWTVDEGDYRIGACKSSAEICAVLPLHIHNMQYQRTVYTINSTFGDIYQNGTKSDVLKPLAEAAASVIGNPGEGNDPGAVNSEMQKAMVECLPLRGVFSFGDGTVSWEDMQEVIKKLNS